MAEEWQEAMTVAEIERIIKTTEPREMSSNGDRAALAAMEAGDGK